MALISSHAAHTAYELQGEVSETIMIGQTADISNIYEYDWYEWVMFLDNVTSYPEDRRTLGRYLGPRIDVGSSLCYNILKADGNISCQSPFRYLILKELVDPIHIKQCDGLNTHISDRLAAASTKVDFEPADLTPDCVYYEDSDSPIQ